MSAVRWWFRCLVLASIVLVNVYRAGAVILIGGYRSTKLGDIDTAKASGSLIRKLSPKAEIFKYGNGAISYHATRRRLEANHMDDAISSQDAQVLISFKTGISSDPLGALENWHANESDPCGWTGVTCASESKQIVFLDLSTLQLKGTVAPVLGNLRFLQHLDLSNNLLYGSIPTSLVNCSNLSYLNLSLNQLDGDIPSQLGNLLDLETLDLLSNNLTGVVPQSLGNCSSLHYLELGSNFLQGEIPSQLGRLYSLEFMSLLQNLLSGSIPESLANCSSLRVLRLTNNANLEGEIPPELGRLSNLQTLSISDCSLQGVFPDWIVNLTSLNVVSLSYNYFHGEISNAIGQLYSLNRLALGGNGFTGVIPVSIYNCTKLSGLAVEQNWFLEGDMPKDLGLLSSLEELDLWGNGFTGLIPSSISNCSGLMLLALGDNPLSPQAIPSWIGSLVSLTILYMPNMSLQGEIPQNLGQLSNLQQLMLTGNNLSGVIPASIGNCTYIQLLELGSNQLRGKFPSQIGRLQQLQYLQLGLNFLSGSFPAFIGNLTEIISLGVQDNELSGTIDHSIGRLGQLDRLGANGNKFYGQIPEEITNCSKLSVLNLGRNALTGAIRPSLGNISTLREVYLQENQFEGRVPLELMRCVGLVTLYLSENRLDGTIPGAMGQLSSLQWLYLNNNNFTGVIPDSFSNCTNMILLDLSYNRFTGRVPGSAFSRMFPLTSLNLSNNLLSGSWPSQLNQLANIQELDVSVNSMSGSIPPGLERCTSLARLDLSFNNFTGPIPDGLQLLQHLKYFNASFNNFQGPITDVGAFKIFTANSFFGNPGLCGSVLPHQQCAAHASAGCQGFNCERVLFIAMSCAIGAGLVLLIGALLCWIRGRKSLQRHRTVNFGTHRTFNEADVLSTITGNGENVIGQGAKSIVYKGILHGGETVIAVKVLRAEHNEDKQWDRQVLKEIQILAKLRHRNIVKVLGYYSRLSVKAVILEYMAQGSLHDHLHGRDVCELTWDQRLNIVVDVGEAMAYLHQGFPEPIIHRDLKPSNILLDGGLVAKVADFGISRFVNHAREGEATVTSLCGTIGYIPPEYGMVSTISTKGDVYSFGIIILELLTRRKPTHMDDFWESGNLVGWVMASFEELPLELLDPTLLVEWERNLPSTKEIMLLMRIGLLCTKDQPQDRPSMTDILGMLHQVKKTRSHIGDIKTLDDLSRKDTI